jgi:hypothetical protein
LRIVQEIFDDLNARYADQKEPAPGVKLTGNQKVPGRACAGLLQSHLRHPLFSRDKHTVCSAISSHVIAGAFIHPRDGSSEVPTDGVQEMHRSSQGRQPNNPTSIIFGVAFNPVNSTWSSFCENTLKVLSIPTLIFIRFSWHVLAIQNTCQWTTCQQLQIPPSETIRVRWLCAIAA